MSPNIVYWEKIASTQSNWNDKAYYGVAVKSFRDSATTPNRLPMMIRQMTHNCLKNFGKSKGATLFQKQTKAPYNLSKRKCYLHLNENLEINLHKEKNLLNKIFM